MKGFIKDESGQEYRIKITKDPPRSLYYELIGRGEFVGCIKWELYPPEHMNINDIYIRDDSDPPDSSICPSYGLTRDENCVRNYRGKDLGTELLKLAIAYARERHLKFIYGSVTKEDIARTTFLLEWYERYGFKKIDERYDGCIPDAVAWVCMELG